MSTTPLNPAGYDAIPVHPSHPADSPRRTITTAAKYGLTILGSVAFTLVLLFGLSSVSSPHPARAVFPRITGRINSLPDKTATDKDTHWTIDTVAAETFEARSLCGPKSYPTTCACEDILNDSGEVCAALLYAALTSDFLTRRDGCYCIFHSVKKCSNANVVMHLDCYHWG